MQMQVPAIVYAMDLMSEDLKQVRHTSTINISPKTLESIKTHTAQDLLFQLLHAHIATGPITNKLFIASCSASGHTKMNLQQTMT